VTPALELAQPALPLVLAFALDVLVGEPPGALHPVVWMGNVIKPLTRLASGSPARDFVVGALYALLVLALFGGAGLVLLRELSPWPLALLVAESYLLWSCFALRGLVQAGGVMRAALERGSLPEAREALTSLCSRDPSTLSAAELAGATVESLTENTSDSVVAPLFYYALFGLPGVLVYRAANTLDAMVGYRGKYEYLGKAAARFDDLLNLVPARLTALLLWLVGALSGLNARGALGVWWRDAQRTESPNAGHPMAMAAGLLSVRLDKRGVYVLGAELGEPSAASVARAMRLVRGAGWLSALLCVILLALRGAAHVAAFD
jgi:adenosylcobinamide-phosphate synthase